MAGEKDDWEVYRLSTAYVLAAAREDHKAMDATFREVLADPYVLVDFKGRVFGRVTCATPIAVRWPG